MRRVDPRNPLVRERQVATRVLDGRESAGEAADVISLLDGSGVRLERQREAVAKAREAAKAREVPAIEYVDASGIRHEAARAEMLLRFLLVMDLAAKVVAHLRTVAVADVEGDENAASPRWYMAELDRAGDAAAKLFAQLGREWKDLYPKRNDGSAAAHAARKSFGVKSRLSRIVTSVQHELRAVVEAEAWAQRETDAAARETGE